MCLICIWSGNAYADCFGVCLLVLVFEHLHSLWLRYCERAVCVSEPIQISYWCSHAIECNRTRDRLITDHIQRHKKVVDDECVKNTPHMLNSLSWKLIFSACSLSSPSSHNKYSCFSIYSLKGASEKKNVSIYLELGQIKWHLEDHATQMGINKLKQKR